MAADYLLGLKEGHCFILSMSKSIRVGIEYILWVATTVIVLRWAFVEVAALYPDWNDARGMALSWLICGVLIVAWICFLVSLFSASLGWLRLWFKIGVCCAVLVIIVRNMFYKEMNEVLNSLTRIIHH